MSASGKIDSGRILLLPIASIRPNPSQPRKVFSQRELEELADSIRLYGILQPLSVRVVEDGLELIAGERRLRAAKLAGLHQVPCILLRAGEADSAMMALIENIQRKNLDFFEQAQALAFLIQQFGLSQEQAAQRLGKSQSAIANKLRLLRLGSPVLCALRDANLTERHARALLRLSDSQQQLTAVHLAAANDWTVSQLERYVDAQLSEKAAPKQPSLCYRLRDTRAFFNAVSHHLERVRKSGIPAQSEQVETEDEIILTIRIRKQKDAAQ